MRWNFFLQPLLSGKFSEGFERKIDGRRMVLGTPPLSGTIVRTHVRPNRPVLNDTYAALLACGLTNSELSKGFSSDDPPGSSLFFSVRCLSSKSRGIRTTFFVIFLTLSGNLFFFLVLEQEILGSHQPFKKIYFCRSKFYVIYVYACLLYENFYNLLDCIVAVFFFFERFFSTMNFWSSFPQISRVSSFFYSRKAS